MELKRFFAPQSALTNDVITISGDEFYHLFKVLRHKEGYKIIVSLEDGKDYYCTITRMYKDYCEAKVDEVKDNPCISDITLTLFQALPKGNKIDFVIQKCVELGVTEIKPFISQYVNETKFNLDRNQRIAIEASKQSCRSIKCEVSDVISFEEMLNQLANYDLVIFAYEKATTGKIGSIPQLKTSKRIAYIIGSEGGFLEDEVTQILNRGAYMITLGSHILRTETASIVVAAIINYEING